MIQVLVLNSKLVIVSTADVIFEQHFFNLSKIVPSILHLLPKT